LKLASREGARGFFFTAEAQRTKRVAPAERGPTEEWWMVKGDEEADAGLNIR
jgi:hypothetical protein